MQEKIINWSNAVFEPKAVKIEPKAENESTKEIQITMAKDSIMKEHKAPFAIFVQVLNGEIDFDVSGKTYRLKSLDMISVDANVPHSLCALVDSIVRLSLAKNDSIKRVSAVLKS